MLRFKADSGLEYPAWEEKTLGELGTFTKGAALSKADISDDGTPLILYGELYTTYNEVAIHIVRRTEQNVADRFLSRVGDVLIPTSGETAEEIATATCVMQEGVVLAGDLYIYRTVDELDGRIASYLLNHSVNRQISNIAQGKSVVHVQAKELSKVIMSYPVSFDEQRKIAALLSSVDDVITAQAAEVAAWEERKKGVMQKLFSQEVRFKADDGSEYPAWEEKTLGECCVYGKERGKGGNYVGTDNMLQDFAGVHFSDDVETSGIVYKTGDVLMSNIRPYLKKVWSADRDGVCSTDVLVFHPTNIEPGYLHHRLASDSFIGYVMSAAKGSKMPRGDKSHIMEMEFLSPCADEQRKIADCLSSFDEVIAKAKDELAAWQELKKGLLQQMFV